MGVLGDLGSAKINDRPGPQRQTSDLSPAYSLPTGPTTSGGTMFTEYMGH